MSAVAALNGTSDSGLEQVRIRAFIVDEPTRMAVTAAIDGANGDVLEGGISAAMASLSQDGSPGLVIVDITDAEDPVAAMALLRKVCGPDTSIVTIGNVNDVELYRSLTEAGIGDYLVKPIQPNTLRKSLERISRPASDEQAEKKSAQVIAVIGARGGVGASTIAVNVAWHIANDMNRQVALLDLDLQFGTVTLSLDLEPCHGMRDILENPERVDSLFISSSMVREGENLLVLGAEEALEHSLSVKPAAVTMLLDGLAPTVDYILMDIPRSLLTDCPEVLKRVDTVLLVADPSLASVRDVTRLAELVRNMAPEANVIVAANKVGANKKGELPVAEFKRNVKLPIEHSIPWDAKTPSEAASVGKALGAVAARTPITRAIHRLGDGMAVAKAKEKQARGLSKWMRKG
jgi:pilus assembly protein CpaE